MGDYTVEGTLRGQRVTRTIKLTELKPLPRVASIGVGRITQTGVDATWSPVAGALSYGAAIILDAPVSSTLPPTFVPVPCGASCRPSNTTYITKTSGTIRRTTYGEKPFVVNRVEVYAFNVDLTEIPPRLSAQFNASWTLSAPFDFPPGNPFVPPGPPPVPGDRPPPPPPGP